MAFAVQYIPTVQLGTGADENDLPWTTWAGHGDYETPEAANEACLEFDAAFDGQYTHRFVEVANDNETEEA